jgi:hypothetical protein
VTALFRQFIILYILILVSFAICIPSCTPAQQPTFGFNPKLSISEPPALGKPVKVILSYTPQKQFDTYSTNIELPTGSVYELIQGNLELNGISGNTNSIEIIIKAIRTTGSGEIIGRVRGNTPHATPWETIYLYVTIDNNGAKVSNKPIIEPVIEPDRSIKRIIFLVIYSLVALVGFPAIIFIPKSKSLMTRLLQISGLFIWAIVVFYFLFFFIPFFN